MSFCKVSGQIRPVDAAAPPIGFEVNLPAQWNGKALQFGGGGYNGRVPQTTSLGNAWPAHRRRRRWARLHHAGQRFRPPGEGCQRRLVRDERRVAGQLRRPAHQKTRDVAVALAKLHYGSTPQRFYFVGGSTGGREALTAALRWPESYDGVIANYPTANFVGLRLWGAALARAIYDDHSAGWIPARAGHSASRPRASRSAMDSTVPPTDWSATCRRAAPAPRRASRSGLQGRPGATDCLTPAQIDRTIKVYHDGFRTRWRAYDGVAHFGGYNSSKPSRCRLARRPPTSSRAVSGPNAHHAARADQFMKYFVTRNPDLQPARVRRAEAGPVGAAAAQVAEVVGAMSSDFRPFARRGGKVLWVQGQDDASVSPYDNSGALPGRRRRRPPSGHRPVHALLLVPGLGHGSGSFLLELGQCGYARSLGRAGHAAAGGAGGRGCQRRVRTARSRPLCAWPTWPKYRGSGSLNEAASFSCAP